LSQEIVEVKAEKETSVEDKPSNTSHFVSKEQKNLQNKLKKLKKKISNYEKEIASLESIFSKTNPSAQELEKYENLRTELAASMQEWEDVASQIE
jgi:ATP-binding cassette subfamily F protein 3